MHKKILLKDIAAAAGVSVTLVSYVMNNRYPDRINKSTADKIRKTAKQLGYRPNQIAKSLKTKTTFTIGLMLGDIMNPYSYHIARIIEDEARKVNYTVIFGSCDENAAQSQRLMDTLINRQVDGFIIAPAAGTQDQLKNLQQLGIPFILIDRYFPTEDFNYIVIDNYAAAYSAVSQLIKNGRKKIGIVNYETELVHLNERTKGYMDALADNGIAFQKEWFCNVLMLSTPQEVKENIDEFVKHSSSSLDAVFTATNALGVETLKRLNHYKIQVPDKMAIICFDETDAVELFYSTLSFIRQPMQQIGNLAVQTLLKMIKENKDEQRYQIVLKSNLVVNQSSG